MAQLFAKKNYFLRALCLGFFHFLPFTLASTSSENILFCEGPLSGSDSLFRSLHHLAKEHPSYREPIFNPERMVQTASTGLSSDEVVIKQFYEKIRKQLSDGDWNELIKQIQQEKLIMQSQEASTHSLLVKTQDSGPKWNEYTDNVGFVNSRYFDILFAPSSKTLYVKYTGEYYRRVFQFRQFFVQLKKFRYSHKLIEEFPSFKPLNNKSWGDFAGDEESEDLFLVAANPWASSLMYFKGGYYKPALSRLFFSIFPLNDLWPELTGIKNGPLIYERQTKTLIQVDFFARWIDIYSTANNFKRKRKKLDVPILTRLPLEQKDVAYDFSQNRLFIKARANGIFVKKLGSQDDKTAPAVVFNTLSFGTIKSIHLWHNSAASPQLLVVSQEGPNINLSVMSTRDPFAYRSYLVNSRGNPENSWFEKTILIKDHLFLLQNNGPHLLLRKIDLTELDSAEGAETIYYLKHPPPNGGGTATSFWLSPDSKTLILEFQDLSTNIAKLLVYPLEHAERQIEPKIQKHSISLWEPREQGPKQ